MNAETIKKRIKAIQEYIAYLDFRQRQIDKEIALFIEREQELSAEYYAQQTEDELDEMR